MTAAAVCTTETYRKTLVSKPNTENSQSTKHKAAAASFFCPALFL